MRSSADLPRRNRHIPRTCVLFADISPAHVRHSGFYHLPDIRMARGDAGSEVGRAGCVQGGCAGHLQGKACSPGRSQNPRAPKKGLTVRFICLEILESISGDCPVAAPTGKGHHLCISSLSTAAGVPKTARYLRSHRLGGRLAQLRATLSLSQP